MLEVGVVQGALGRWWFDYDAGNFDAWPVMFTPDIHFTCRTDTGATEYEEFVRADLHDLTSFLEWQTEHRTNSPYPLRHNASNVHLTAARENEVDFASYLFVTQILA